MKAAQRYPYPYNLVQDVLELDDKQMDEYLKNPPVDLKETIDKFVIEQGRDTLKQIYINGKTQKEVAETEGITSASVSHRKRQELKKLRHPTRIIYVKYGTEGAERIRENKRLERERKDAERCAQEAIEEKEKDENLKNKIKEELERVEIPFDKKLKDLGIPTRNVNAFEANGIVTISEFIYENFHRKLRRPRGDFRFGGVGKKGMAYIFIILRDSGFDTSILGLECIEKDSQLLEKVAKEIQFSNECEIALNKKKKHEIALNKKKDACYTFIQTVFQWTDEMVNRFKLCPNTNLVENIDHLLERYLTPSEKEAIEAKFFEQYENVDEDLLNTAFSKLQNHEIEKMIVWDGLYSI